MLGNLRSATAAFALAGALAVFAGCGSSASHTTSAGSTGSAGSAAASAAAPSAHISRAQAAAYARTVNLTTVDVPGSAIVRGEREATVTSGETREQRCSGAVSPKLRVADVKSDVLRVRAGEASGRVKSDVQVLPDAALAAKDFDAQTSARGRRCLQAKLQQVVAASRSPNVSATGASISTLPRPLPGANSFAARLRLGLQAATGRKVDAFIDVLAFQTGPAEVTLTALTLGRPPSAATESKLLATLYERARKHPL